MRRSFVFSVGLGAIAVLVAGSAYLVHRYHEDLVSYWMHDSTKSYSLDDAKKMSDRQLVETIAAGEAPWDLIELKDRCRKYSPAQLDAVADTVVEIAFPMNDRHGEASRFLEDVRNFLPAQRAEKAIRCAMEKRAEVAKGLDEYIESQCSPDGSHSPEDADRLYQLYVDLDGPEKYPQVFERMHCLGSTRARLMSQTLEALSHCGAPGLEKLRQLGQSGRVFAVALLRTGRPEDIAELVGLCQDRSVPEDQFHYVIALAYLEENLRTNETQDTLRKELVSFLENPDPRVRIRAAQSAAGSEDTYFLSALEDLAANDPYHETDRRSVSGGVHIEETYERYIVRENAAWAVEKVRMLDPAHQAMREAEKERTRRLNEIRSLESNLVAQRRQIMYAMHSARSAQGDGSAASTASWVKCLGDLSEARDDMLRELADLRNERARVLGEEDLAWHRTELELLTAIADDDEWASEVLGKRCTLYSEDWVEEVALLILDAEEQADPQAAQCLVTAANASLPERVRGPLAEYRLARDGDDATKGLFAAKVAAGMTTGRPMVTLLHQLDIRIEDPGTQSGASLMRSYEQAVLSHGRRAFFLAPNFLTSRNRTDQNLDDFVPDGLAEGQRERLLEYRELKEKVRQIDSELADVRARDWLVSAITQQRTEARHRMDVLWRELHRTATVAVTGQ